MEGYPRCVSGGFGEALEKDMGVSEGEECGALYSKSFHLILLGGVLIVADMS